MTYDKIIVLDTDFIFKMYNIRKDDTESLMDKIMNLQFDICCCHSRIVEEIRKNTNKGATTWLEDKIKNGKILEFSDRWILEKLNEELHNSTIIFYVRMLEVALNSIKDGTFKEIYTQTNKLDFNNVSLDIFLKAMEEDEKKHQVDFDLGEIKTLLLIQVLQFKYKAEITLFCSDDSKARNGVCSIPDVKCISVLSSFIRLFKEKIIDREDAIPYMTSYIDFLSQFNQSKFKIQDSSKRNIRVDCSLVLEGIFNDEFYELKNGMLRYKK